MKSSNMSSTESPLSVSAALDLSNRLLKTLPRLAIIGEISGYHGPKNGHHYFAIKDESGVLNVNLWRSVYAKYPLELEDGKQVIVTGSFDIYAGNGKFSLNATKIELAGEGYLLQQIEERKRRLAAEGLFDESRKLPLDRFLEHVICVTSLNGKARYDVETSMSPLVKLDFVGCNVQGVNAPESMIRALKFAEAQRPDAIIFGRGGGSLEDLMCFNDEGVARTIAGLSVPVITGIGHEKDMSICDYVADRCCITPTAAAKSCAPSREELDASLLRSQKFLLSHATRLVDQETTRMDNLGQRMYLGLSSWVTSRNSTLKTLERRLDACGPRLTKPYSDQVMALAQTLEALSPLKVLTRGYALVTNDDKRVIRSSSELTQGQDVSIQFAEGSARATITQITNTNDS